MSKTTDMSTTTVEKDKNITAWVDNFELLMATLKDSPESVTATRKNAFEVFEKEGFPNTKLEEWKYTSVLPLLKKDFKPVFFKQNHDISPAVIGSAIPAGLEAHVLVFINGFFAPAQSRLRETAEGVTLSSVAEELKVGNELVIDNFGQHAAITGEPFTALNSAFAQDGAYIHIARGKSLNYPVLILNIIEAKNANTLANVRNLILIDENSTGTVIETTLTLGHNGLLNTVTEVVVGKNAQFTHYLLQNDNDRAHQMGTTRIAQNQGSKVTNYTLTTGGAFNRNNLSMLHTGENCESWMYGIYLLSEQAHCDNHTLVDHAQPNCYSNELYKGILSGTSTGVFNGKVIVRQDAQKTNAFQSNKNILLSNGATINTKPQLEIFADDVKCSHGATTGQLDPDALFYLQVRGIPKEEAKGLLTMAFTSDVVEKIDIQPIRHILETAISTRVSQESKLS